MLRFKFLKKLIAAFCAATIVGTALVPSVGAFGVTEQCLNSKIIVTNFLGTASGVDENIKSILNDLDSIKKVTDEIVFNVSKQEKYSKQLQEFKKIQLQILTEVNNIDSIQNVNNPYHLHEIKERIHYFLFILNRLKKRVCNKKGEEESSILNIEKGNERECFYLFKTAISNFYIETQKIIEGEFKNIEKNKSKPGNILEPTQEYIAEMKKLKCLVDEHMNMVEKFFLKVYFCFKSVFNEIYKNNCNKIIEKHFRKIEAEVWRRLVKIRYDLSKLKDGRNRIKTTYSTIYIENIYKKIKLGLGYIGDKLYNIWSNFSSKIVEEYAEITESPCSFLNTLFCLNDKILNYIDSFKSLREQIH